MKYFYSLLFFVVCLIGIQTKINAQASCASAAPFCTSAGVNFPASTNTTAATGPNYGCLLSQPNPAWYYLNISTSGNIQINLTNSANVDIDFIIWGPFASQAAMCGGLNNSGVDCSYSMAANEQVDIPNATAGQWYMLLITNFSGQPTNISATAQNAPGTDGTTNCAILCNMTGLTANPGACVSPANTFTLTGTVTATNPPSTGTMTVTSSCGGSQIFNPPFAGSINYTLPNIPANGSPCTVTATYSADPTCTLTTNYVAPPSCNVVACNISNFTANISACAVATNTYTVNGAVTFTNPPATGTMTVTTCGGNSQTFNAPFVSPINYNITGIPADGTTNCNVTVVFSAAGACTQTVGPFTEPVCLCNMDNMAVNVGACDPITTTYSVTVDLTFTSPPSTGNLQVTVCGVTQNIPMPATSPQTFTFTGLTPDGLACNAVSSFTAAPTCGNTVPFTAPTGCDCVVDAGTFTDNIVGSGTTNYLLCFNDVLDIISNGNMVDPNLSLNNPGVTYDPGLWLLAYSCPPTIFPQDDFLTDPCLLGVADATDGDWSILNNIGDGSTVYFVPLTMYSMINGFYSATDFAGSCYDMGPVYPVTFLPEVLATGVESCPNGTVTVTVSGGVPATTGGNFTASNLLPATATFNNTTAANNGTIVISGLTNGQIYSFDIADANGCPVTFTGGPFVGPVATSINPAGPFCLSDPSVNLVDVPATTGTYTGIGITNAANGTFDPATAGIGTHIITYTPTGCFLPSTLNISVNDIFDATINPAGPFCASNGNTFLGAVDAGGTWSGTGIVGGTNTTGEFSPSLAGAGNHNITYTILGACGDVGTTVIQVIADADATITPAGPFCISDPAVNLVGAQTGGVWSGTGITSAANGTFNPATAGAGTHTITYNIAGVCGDVQTTNITVISLFPSTITPVGPFCQNAASVNLVGATPGGTWSGTGITNTATGTFDPNTAGPGTHTITYTLGGNCGTSSTLNIVVNPLPVPTFSADVLSGCAPLTVTLTDNTLPAASSTVWTIVGETSSNNNGSFIYTFNNPGVYSVTLTLTSAAGCVGTATINNMINVFPNPVADFSFGPTGADVTNSLINFTNESTLNDLNNWDFGGLGSSTQANPSFTFPSDSPGNYTVCLAVETANGCVDTTCQTIIINDIFIIYVPNAFTPNDDGINDYFLPILSGFDPLSYELIIFNRWGELIFESQNQEVWWDGTHKGIMCKEDVYVWKIKVKDAIENKKREYIGHVSLLK